MADVFDQLAAQQTPQAPPPQQSGSVASTQPQPQSGDIFDALAAQQNASTAAPVQAQPDTFWGRAKQLAEHPIDTLTGATPGYGPNNPGEQDKQRIWHQASQDFQTGNYKKASSDLLDVLNPNKNAAAKDAYHSAAQAGIGAAKSAGQTAATAAQVGADISTLGLDRVLEPQSVKNAKARMDARLQPSNGDQAAGRMAEQVIEFILADGLTRGLPYSENLAQAGKLAKFLEHNPRLARIVGSAVRNGAIGGTVGGVHGGPEGAAEGAALGAGLGGTVTAIGEVPGAIGDAIRTAAESEAEPVEAQVAKATAKSGIAEGEAATEPPTGEDIQPNLQQGIRNVAAQVAKDTGVEYKEPASIRDAIGTTSRNVLTSASADFKALDDASGGRWQRFSDQIKNIQLKMNEVNGIDEDQYANLEVKRNEIELAQAQMVEDLKESGKVDPAIADRAVAQYRRGMALADVDSAIKASTKRVPVGGKVQEVVDPNALSNRLSKLADTPPKGGPSRLEQALGKDGARSVIEHVDNAQLATQAIKDFTPSTATGQKALAHLIRDNTAGKSNLAKLGKIEGRTNWNGVIKAFENLSTDEQQKMFGSEVAQVRRYIQRQALKQNAIATLKNVGKTGLILGTGYEAVKK